MSSHGDGTVRARWSGLGAIAGAFAVLLALVATSAAIGDAAGEGTSRYIVVLENSVDSPGAVGRAQTEQLGGHLGFVYRYGPIGYSATLPAAAVEALRRDPRVRAVRADQLVVTAAAQTKPTGIQRVFALANKALKIDEATNFTVDADVAVIDTGVDYEHPDLKVVKRTYCDGTEVSATCTNEASTDEHGHGTHVAGTIAAIDNTVGVVGVAPSARIWAVKVLDPKAWESEIVAGVNWVTARSEEIEVANMSIGCEKPCTLNTMKEAVVKSTEAGVVYVIAAGNLGKDSKETTFATIPNTITVSAIADYDGESGEKAEVPWVPSCSKEKQEKDTGKVGEDDKLATFSNFGKDVEMTAPGVCIYSTFKEKKYAYDYGTSMAAPHVAGAAAILAAQSNPNSLGDVEAINETLIGEGNLNWKDISGDGAQEPLLDVSNEGTFK